MTINAASNFILYCLLSDKYRKTVKTLFCGVRLMRRNTSSSSRCTSGRTTSSFYSRSRNSNVFNMPIHKQRGPRFSISKEEYANLQAETAKRNRFSLSTLTSPSQNFSTVNNPVLCHDFFLFFIPLSHFEWEWWPNIHILLRFKGTENDNVEEIQLKPTAPPPKQEKHRMKSIRFSFTPSNVSIVRRIFCKN